MRSDIENQLRDTVQNLQRELRQAASDLRDPDDEDAPDSVASWLEAIADHLEEAKSL
jgi:hypothetical protein